MGLTRLNQVLDRVALLPEALEKNPFACFFQLPEAAHIAHLWPLLP